ncbi:hypothetical protein [Streptomyces mirabilis]|uniref:hypothetical protein n=1 Tax=Streptomyces mirabilis TaxID=68239 RepID=UPI003F4BB434
MEVRRRGHACVEDHIRCGKTTGLGRFLSRALNVNAAWLELGLTPIDLPAGMRVLLLDGEFASVEPRKLLPAAARRRTPHPRRTPPPPADIGDLALGARKTLKNPATASGLRHAQAAKVLRPTDN